MVSLSRVARQTRGERAKVSDAEAYGIDAARAQRARVGPNAVLQLAASLRSLTDEHTTAAVFAAAGQASLLSEPPAAMVPEDIPARLFTALYQQLSPALAEQVATDAGRRTADYLLANRIPGFAQWLLRLLPTRVAAPILLKAIHRNAWTFAGSGDCTIETGRPLRIEIARNPVSMPDCHWQQAVFARLFAALVAAEVQVQHSECCHRGASCCRFQIIL